MFNTIDDTKLVAYKNAISEHAAQHKQSLSEAWHLGEWPKHSWETLSSHNDFLTNIDIENKQELLRAFTFIEGFCRGSGDSSFCTSLIVQYLLCYPIRNKYFKHYTLDPNEVLCFGLTETKGGSAPFDMGTTLKPNKNVINGIKWHITNSPPCNHMLIFGKEKKSQQHFLAMIPRNQKGVRIKKLNAEGMKNSPVGIIHLLNTPVKKENFIVSSKDVKIAMGNAFILERLGVGFAAIGTVEHHLEILLKYVRQRKVANQRIIKHQYIQKRLTDIKINLDALKSLVQITISEYLSGCDISSLASQVKLKAIQNVREFCQNAISCYGSYGIQREVGLIRVLNDSMGGSIAGGTEEIHRNMIFSKMLREH